MNYLFKLKLSSEVSLVVCPIDSLTGERVSTRGIKVYLKDLPVKPIVKPDGYFVFTGLDDGNYTVFIESDIYFNECIDIRLSEIDSRDKLLYVQLKPRPSYSFMSGTTLVRLTVRSSYDHSPINAAIFACVQSEECTRGRLKRDGLKEGDDVIVFASLAGKIAEGDMLQLIDKDSGCSETISVLRQLDDPNSFRLLKSLENDYQRGTLILPVISVVTADNGEAVLFFRNLRTKRFKAGLKIKYMEKEIIRQIELEEGKTLLLGCIEV